MSVHMSREIEKLKKRILSLGAMVEEHLLLAMRALESGDPEQAKAVRKSDQRIDQAEVEVEEESMKILALYQPVATDLRFVISILKINNDLERIGDQAVNIAEKVKFIGNDRGALAIINAPPMLEKATQMLRQSLDALVGMDAAMAIAVCKADDEVDRMKREAREAVIAEMQVRPEKSRCLLGALGVARNLERIADLSTNIAEDVIYLVQAKIIRHGSGGDVLGRVAASASRG